MGFMGFMGFVGFVGFVGFMGFMGFGGVWGYKTAVISSSVARLKSPMMVFFIAAAARA